MTLHFAYGANMSGAVMRRYAPGARALGVAALSGYRFVITADGYASVVPDRAQVVHGVLWRLIPRDRVTLDAWENVAAGLYRAETVPVRSAGRRLPALVYVARAGGPGRPKPAPKPALKPAPKSAPKPGYLELVIAAAREWDLPADYIGLLQRLLPARTVEMRSRKIGEFR